VSAVLCDIIITIGMSYYLFKSKTGFKATDDMLSKITRLIIETGFLTSTFALLDLALSLAFEQWNYHLAVTLALSKLYSNNLLVVSVTADSAHHYHCLQRPQDSECARTVFQQSLRRLRRRAYPVWILWST
jgi:hypothetical protein